MDVTDRLRAVIEPMLGPRGIEVFDVELVGNGSARVLRLLVDRDGGVDLDTITEVTKLVSPALDEEDLLDGRYTLEVSSPGLERPLRTPAHFERAVGRPVSVKTRREIDGERRHQGELLVADDDGITLAVEASERRLAHADISSARTVFEWGPGPKPGSGDKRQKKSGAASRQKKTKV